MEHEGGTGLIGGLKVGQPVTLNALGLAFEIGAMGNGLPTGLEVAGVGPDCLVGRDVAVAVETRIPVTSIKAVVLMTEAEE